MASFVDADFALDIPAEAFWEGVSCELALDRPRSEQTDWGQYWLRSRLEEWPLAGAEYAIRGVSPDAEPGAGAGTEPGGDQS